MTTAEQRAYVEARWRNPTAAYHNCGMASSYWTISTEHGNEIVREYCGALTGEGPIWSAAYIFTVAHEQKIAWVREEIYGLKLFLEVFKVSAGMAWCKRLLAKAEAELQGLLRGFREQEKN